ncbi:sugar transferase [Zhengella sp. ZM62]|uniref:sugar transferase n=1 Tax=Zhengella sedimenti TaxID=3390035 RepID=UPI00397543C1
MLETVFWTGALAALHHHLIYPLSLLALARRANSGPMAQVEPPPHVTLIVTAYQEARTISAKIANIGALDYPAERLHVRIHCDGSTDGTPSIAVKDTRALQARGIDARVHAHAVNRGKIAVINEAVGASDTPLVALTDASASLPSQALWRAAAAFADETVGVAGGLYDCAENGTPGERRYWEFQNRLRLGEAALGSPLGFSGAFHVFRRAAFRPLAAGTINDDFILPMGIVAQGYRGVLDAGIAISERERTRPGQEFARRLRIGAGNLQQAIRLFRLADPRRPGLAYAFLSGKGLRAIMPFLLLAAFVSLTLLGLSQTAWIAPAVLAWTSLLFALSGLAVAEHRRSRLQTLAATVLAGYAASGFGALMWMLGRFDVRGQWAKRNGAGEDHALPPSVRLAKRAFDLAGGSVLLALLAVVYGPVALAIKLESRGPVFYRQLRVGRALPDRTELFELIKFRTMGQDAERNGAAWASKGDPRVTRVGRFLRRTRIDELPQAINVLRGEMSLIGPRPERPVFFGRLETSIPLYVERTYGILPGVTGLAQVRQGYDESIEDVRSKVGWDHAYALRIDSLWAWLKTDLAIALETIGVMAGRKGQ